MMDVQGQLTVSANSLLQVGDLSHGRVLSAGAQQVAQGFEGHLAGATLVEQREGFFVVGGVLLIVLGVRHDDWGEDYRLWRER